MNGVSVFFRGGCLCKLQYLLLCFLLYLYAGIMMHIVMACVEI
jgi:hypothetical protein